MKESELRENARCSICNELIGHTGLPIFWTLKVERHGIDARAAQKQSGLAMMLGNAALAQVMGPDEEMTKTIMGPINITLCEECALSPKNEIIMAAFDKAEVDTEEYEE